MISVPLVVTILVLDASKLSACQYHSKGNALVKGPLTVDLEASRKSPGQALGEDKWGEFSRRINVRRTSKGLNFILVANNISRGHQNVVNERPVHTCL